VRRPGHGGDLGDLRVDELACFFDGGVALRLRLEERGAVLVVQLAVRTLCPADEVAVDCLEDLEQLYEMLQDPLPIRVPRLAEPQGKCRRRRGLGDDALEDILDHRLDGVDRELVVGASRCLWGGRRGHHGWEGRTMGENDGETGNEQ
jgi:hypothetical protein